MMDKCNKILVVDDIREFRFDEWYTVTYARNIVQAGKLLADNHWCEVWLDHDMGNDGDVSLLVNDIEKMAGEDNTILDVSMFVIHTSNPVEAGKMYAALSPFYRVRIESNVKLFVRR